MMATQTSLFEAREIPTAFPSCSDGRHGDCSGRLDAGRIALVCVCQHHQPDPDITEALDVVEELMASTPAEGPELAGV